MTVDEAAEALGVELLPWQRDVGQRLLNGERNAMIGGRRAGRTTLRRVIAHARADRTTGASDEASLVGPDCRDGKHVACDGRAFDGQADEIVDCECMCPLPQAA